MNKALDILARARAARPAPAPAPMNQPAPPKTQPTTAYVTVKPPDIPPMMPKPRDPTIYRQLMQNHDRLGTRHLKK